MIRAIFDRLLSALFMIIFMQIPAFIQDYIQVLSGHVAELNYQLSLYVQVAKDSNKNLSDLTHRFLNNNDPEIKSLGQILSQLIERAESFTQSLNLLTTSPGWKKPFVLFSRLDWSCFKETLGVYQINLPLTLESFIYGLVGLGIGALIAKLITGRKRLNDTVKNSTQ